ncbi:MAG: hypothetical protein CMJ18_24200 [Phycisphaeraceae bacterium]|nr:hypothetical protein [Phycisphaeraceae bacterium]
MHLARFAGILNGPRAIVIRKTGFTQAQLIAYSEPVIVALITAELMRPPNEGDLDRYACNHPRCAGEGSALWTSLAQLRLGAAALGRQQR